MEQLVKSIITYKALDGEVFDSRQACEAYEDSLPKHLRWCLANQVTQEKLIQEEVWLIGYQTSQARTKYEAPAFLRKGGEYTVYDSADHVTGYVRGSYSDAVSWAVEQPGWFNRNGFIRPIKIVDLGKAHEND